MSFLLPQVYILQHINPTNDDAKLIGVYAAMEDAEEAIKRICTQPGFKESPDSFVIDRYEIGQDHWKEGFITCGQHTNTKHP